MVKQYVLTEDQYETIKVKILGILYICKNTKEPCYDVNEILRNAKDINTILET